MDRRIAIVTGANRGIGKQTALALARAGLEVVMACRNVQRATAARDEIAVASGNDRIRVYELDLASFASVRGFAERFGRELGRLSVLVNNAGVSTQERERTEDGFEPNFATNVLGPFLLTSLMLPYFIAGEDNRIVNLSSDFYKFGRFRIEKLERYRWIKAYAASKYAVLLATRVWAERLRARGIAVNAAHPGVVRTSIMLTGKWYDAIIKLILATQYVEPAEGAATSLRLALAPELRGATGGYYIRGRKVPIPRRFDDAQAGEELFAFACEATGARDPKNEGRA